MRLFRPRSLLAVGGVVTVMTAAIATPVSATVNRPLNRVPEGYAVDLTPFMTWTHGVWNQTVWWNTVIEQEKELRVRRTLARPADVACTVALHIGNGVGGCNQPTAPAPSPSSSSYNATGSVNGEPCGGDLPPCCVLRRESNGVPTARNPSGAGGLWQFMPSTWNGFGGYSNAADAPPSVQNEKARQVWAGGAGGSNWYPRCW